MNNISKTALAITLALGLTACGGSSSSKADIKEIPVTPPVTTPVPVKTAVVGKAIKGTLFNAIVNVYKFDEGTAVALTATEIEEANISTDDKGNYSFTLLDYIGPLKVELSVSQDTANPTTMICDAPAGCGASAFGEVIDLTALDNTFTLAAISVVSAESNGAVTTNVSALTHLAAALIEANETGITPESIQEKSSLIANAFRIEGNLTTLEPTAVENAAGVADEDNGNELRYGLINAGIMSALFSDETDSAAVLSGKLAEVVADLVANDGAFLVNQDDDVGFELALTDVFSGAGAAAEAVSTLIAADDSLTASDNILNDLSQLETNLANEVIAEEALVGEDGRSKIGTSVPTDGGNIAKAAAMVEDVRLFANLFDVSGQANQDITTQGDTYLQLIDDASIMIEAEGDSFTLLAEISDVISSLILQIKNDTVAGTTFPISDLLSADDAEGTVTIDQDGLNFAVDATAGGQTVKLAVSAVISSTNNNIVLNFDGLLESSGASLTLAEGSKAVVTFDVAPSRETIESNTFDGEIISGELDLTVSLAQTVTDTVTNPVTFTGKLTTKLMPLEVPMLTEDSYWSEQANKSIYFYGKPTTDIKILPEMLSLSGEFSALSGDLIKASLTVNINDLDDYQPPAFEHIGKEIPNFVNYTLTDELFEGTDIDGSKITFTFSEQGEQGEWNVSLITDGKADSSNDLIAEYFYSRQFDVGLDMPGYVISYSWDYKLKDDSYGAEVYVITPIDPGNNGHTTSYRVQRITTNDGLSYDSENLFNDDGNLLLADGSIHNFENANDYGEYSSVEGFLNQIFWISPIHPELISSAGDYAASYIPKLWNSNWFFYNVPNEGLGRVSFDDEALTALQAGNKDLLPSTAFIIKPLLVDAAKIVVSDDANTITTTLGDTTTIRTFEQAENGSFSVNHNSVEVDGDERYEHLWSTKTDIGLDIDELTVNALFSSNDRDNSWGYKLKIVPVDVPVDGQSNAVADHFNVYALYGSDFNDNGDLIDEAGEVLVFEEHSWHMTRFDSYDDVDWGRDGFEYMLPFNPMTASNVLDVYKGYVINSWKHWVSAWAEKIGQVEVKLTDERLATIVAGSSTAFDAINTRAESLSTLESATTFLKGNAALALEVVLGDYQVELELSGDKTGFVAGAFDLRMAYKLPSDSAQRSFVVHTDVDLKEADDGLETITITNTEEVSVVLTESLTTNQGAGENILGTITVGTGDAAEQVAQIVDRGGMILVVYSNGTIESL